MQGLRYLSECHPAWGTLIKMQPSSKHVNAIVHARELYGRVGRRYEASLLGSYALCMLYAQEQKEAKDSSPSALTQQGLFIPQLDMAKQ